MKKTILLFLILTTVSITAQDKVKSFQLNDIISLSNMSKEEAHEWLTDGDFFEYLGNTRTNLGNAYALNFNEDKDTADVWVVKPTEKGSFYVSGKRPATDFIRKQLKPYRISSNLTDEGILTNLYKHKNKKIILDDRNGDVYISIHNL